MASWLPFRQGTAAGAVNATHNEAGDNDVDGSTPVGTTQGGDEDEAYTRLQPDIERDDPLFLAKVAEFQALLDYPGQSIRGVVNTAGFTSLEQQLLIALPSPRENVDLYNLQHKQRWWYYYGLQQSGLYKEEPPAVHLALCWFGAPFSSLALDADGNITSFISEGFLNGVANNAYRPDEDDGNSLQFLDKYSLSDYRGILFNLTEDNYEAQTRPRSDQLDHYLTRLQKRYPLRGGAATPPSSPYGSDEADDANDANKSSTKGKIIRLYGFQGAVNFDIYNHDSLSDAVARLMGPTTKVNFALYTVTPALAPSGKPVAARPPNGYVAGRTYNFQDIQDCFGEDGAENIHALFVCAIDEQPPAEQWVPSDSDPAYAETVVYCSRTSTSNSNYASLNGGDEAYLRLPLNAEDLSPNQYFEWMLVVARILTPGAGLDALNRNESGVLARSHFGLHRNSDPVLFDPKTPAGLCFSPRSWEMLVCDAMDAWAEQKPARAEFDVVPVAKDMISVHLPGLNFETAPISAAAFSHPASFDDQYNVKRGAPFREDLAAKVHQLLKDALTEEEHDQLDCVNIWPDGRFWHESPISVALGDFGDKLKGFEDRWAVRDLQSYMHCVPSATVIRPIYQSYTAILDGNVSIVIGSHDTLDGFRDRLRKANVSGLDPDTDHIFIRQTAQSYNMYPELNADMTDMQRKQANRPGFFISPQSTDEEWQLVRSQIISPTIWISQADIEAALRPPVHPSQWGFREQYGNMLDVVARMAHDRLLDEYWEVAVQRGGLPSGRGGQGGGGGDGGGDDDDGDNADTGGNEDDALHLLEQVLHHASDLQHALTQGDPAQLNATDASSMSLLPLTYEANKVTPSEAAQLTSFKDLYNIALRRPMPCPYADCGLVFGGEEGESRRSAGDFITHCEKHLSQKEQGTTQQLVSDNNVTACSSCDSIFGAKSTDAEKLQHLIDAHSLIYCVQEEGKLVETAPPQEDEGEAMEVDYREPGKQSGLATPPSSASKTAKRKRHSGKATRRTDPSYKPDQDDDTDDDDTNQDSQSSSSGPQEGLPSQTAAKKAGRAAKRRKTAEKDSIYRPQKDGDDAEDDDLQSDDVDDSLDSPVKKTTSKKRKRDADPSYRPRSEDTDEDVVDTFESADGTAGRKAKKKNIGLDDPSFRPKEPTGQLYIDDQDEELRRSAVPEWERDPTDPAGKRKRVIREKSTGLAKTVVKAKDVPRAVTPAKSRAATPLRSTPLKTGPQDTSPAEGTRRSGRGRQPSQRLKK
ncbi:hypothetical protein F503_04100 [Ophiostoma piceae UAMH 11346]|uniref:Uncharacterized protein n=1 Tax=Ophiostoma piceae (strain UAMH 11346) TaxID=1262450 RepID=S3CPM0_OPHP1|nr:hypothetical protein F503_04100 [Ophiostoma piceae UAMH 11346]